MRNFLFLTICSALLIASGLDLKAQCQSGYTHKVDTLMSGDGYCKEYATYCWNGTNVVKTSIYTQSAPIECGLEEWNVVVPQNVGDKSVCFIYHSPCNP